MADQDVNNLPVMDLNQRLEDSILDAQISEHSNRSETNTMMIGLIVVLILMVSSTIICGSNWGRWGNFNAILQQAAGSLEAIPEEFGVWEKSGEDEELNEDAISQLELSDYIVRRYVNKETAEQVSLIFLIGPTGRLTVHTPAVCFGGRNFTLASQPEAVAFPFGEQGGEEGEKAAVDTFQKIVFKNQSVNAGAKIFYYAGSVGGPWEEIGDNARTKFSKYRVMYKLQLEAFSMDESIDENDVVARFLREFLPLIRGKMIQCK